MVNRATLSEGVVEFRQASTGDGSADASVWRCGRLFIELTRQVKETGYELTAICESVEHERGGGVGWRSGELNLTLSARNVSSLRALAGAAISASLHMQPPSDT